MCVCRKAVKEEEPLKRIVLLLLALLGGIIIWTGGTVTAEEENASSPAVLSFSSFDGGGYVYTVEIGDPSILSCAVKRDYGSGWNELETGSPYHEIFTFTGIKPGTTSVTIYGRSPILENTDAVYTASVDEKLNVTLTSIRAISTFFLSRSADIAYDTYNITLGQDGYHVSINEGKDRLIDSASVDALMKIIDEYELSRWDGFIESQPFVLDGESFWLEIKLTDGTIIRARGDNRYPENYFEAISRIQGILSHAKTASGFAGDIWHILQSILSSGNTQ